MSKNLKIAKGAIEDILMSAPVQSFVDRVGKDIARTCGEGYEYKPPTRNERRSRGIVVAQTWAARKDNIKNMRMSKVLVSYHI